MPHRRREDVTFTEIEETGEAVLFVPSEQRAVVVNATAAVVWLLCNGQRDAGAIAQEVGATTGTLPPLGDVQRILGEMITEGILVE